MTIYFSYLLYLYSLETVMQMSVWFPDKLPQEAVFDKLSAMWIKATMFIVGFHLIVLPVLGLFYSHRVAGPLLVLSNKLKELQQGKMPTGMHLRKESYLQDIALEFNKALETLSNKDQIQQQRLTEILTALENQDVERAKVLLAQAIAIVPAVEPQT